MSLTLMCAIKGEQPPPASDVARPMELSDGDQYSLYGSWDSEEEAEQENPANNAPDVYMESLEDIKRCISAMNATQNVIVNKLSSLEKVVTCVQDDTTWVKADVSVVHEILEKIADYVSMLTPTVADVDGGPKHRSPQKPPWGTWQDDAHAKDYGRAETTTIAEHGRDSLGNEDRSHTHEGHDADSSILETQMFDTNTGIQTNTTNMEEEGDERAW